MLEQKRLRLKKFIFYVRLVEDVEDTVIFELLPVPTLGCRGKIFDEV